MPTIVQLLQSIPDCILGKGTTKAALQQAESELHMKFAADYCEYLLNIGLVAFCGHELTGICKSSRLNVVDTTKAEKKKNGSVPDDFYVIEKANIDGIVIWQKSTGEIFETAYDGAPTLIYKSLGDYIEHCVA